MWLLLTQAYNIVRFFGIIILIEETYSYPHVCKFPENILKFLYGGTFEKCKLFFETHCILRLRIEYGRAAHSGPEWQQSAPKFSLVWRVKIF